MEKGNEQETERIKEMNIKSEKGIRKWCKGNGKGKKKRKFKNVLDVGLLLRIQSSGTWRRVARNVRTNISDQLTVSIFVDVKKMPWKSIQQSAPAVVTCISVYKTQRNTTIRFASIKLLSHIIQRNLPNANGMRHCHSITVWFPEIGSV